MDWMALTDVSVKFTQVEEKGPEFMITTHEAISPVKIDLWSQKIKLHSK